MRQNLKKIIAEFPQERQYYIRNNHIPLSDLKRHGVMLIAPDEIFVRIPRRWKEYVISSYGRVFSLKRGAMRYIPPYDANGYEIVSIYSLPDQRKKRKKGIQRAFTIQQLMGMAFLPNEWNIEGRRLQVHHCDHNTHNNYWKNLIRVPVWHHKKLNLVQQVWVRGSDGKQFRRRTYYEIARMTGETLDNILKLLSHPEEFVSEQGGKYLRCYDVGKYTIGFQMTDAYNNRM